VFDKEKKISVSNNSNLSIEITDESKIDNIVYFIGSLEEKKFESEKEKSQFIEENFMGSIYKISVYYKIPWRKKEVLVNNGFVLDKNRVYYGKNISNIIRMISYLFNRNLIIDMKLEDEQYVKYKDLETRNILTNNEIYTLQNLINNSSVNQDEFAPLIMNNVQFPYIVYYGLCNYGRYEVTVVDKYNFSLFINDQFISMYKTNDGVILDYESQIVPESEKIWNYFIGSTIELVETSLFPVRHKVDMTFSVNRIARIIDSDVLDNIYITHTDNFYAKFCINNNHDEIFLEIFDDYYVLENKVYKLNNVGSYFEMLLKTN